MVDAYDPHLCDLARHIAAQYAIVMHDGVYAGLVGPAYESPAEARLLRSMGADAVGMSTVLETIAARALGMSVVGFSLVTNVHLTGDATSHAAVIAASQRGAADVATLDRRHRRQHRHPAPRTRRPGREQRHPGSHRGRLNSLDEDWRFGFGCQSKPVRFTGRLQQRCDVGGVSCYNDRWFCLNGDKSNAGVNDLSRTGEANESTDATRQRGIEWDDLIDGFNDRS